MLNVDLSDPLPTCEGRRLIHQPWRKDALSLSVNPGMSLNVYFKYVRTRSRKWGNLPSNMPLQFCPSICIPPSALPTHFLFGVHPAHVPVRFGLRRGRAQCSHQLSLGSSLVAQLTPGHPNVGEAFNCSVALGAPLAREVEVPSTVRAQS